MSPRAIYIFLLLVSAAADNNTWASEPLPSCYAGLYLGEPQRLTPRALYLFIDQTTPLTAAMRSNIIDLTGNWGSDGERVKIVRFSANISGQYTELILDEFADPPPTQDYLFNLHPDDKPKLIECLKAREQMFRTRLRQTLGTALSMNNSKLPKTDVLYALKELASKMLVRDTGLEQIVLLVSDGLENSIYASFYQRKTVIKPLDTHKTIEEASKNNLIAQWHGAKVYMYGLGYIPDDKIYANPKMLQPLKEFWQSYFSLGKAQLMELGTPELLVSSLKSNYKNEKGR